MKRIFTLAVLLAAAALSSCQKGDGSSNCPDVESENHTGDIRLILADDVTKASDNTHDATLSDIQILLFNGTSGETYRYDTLSKAEISAKSCEIKNVNVGEYSMYVIANGPSLSAVKTLDALKATLIPLGDYNDPGKDFVMEWHSDGYVNVTGDAPTSVSASLSRFVSRVTLSKIENNLPSSLGQMTVNYAFLMNVVGNQIISGAASASVWYNQDGVADETSRQSDHYIGTGSYTASCPALTYAGYASSVNHGASITAPKYFYGYPNSLTAKSTGFSNPFTPKATYLVISATFNGHTYFYPVRMSGGLARNCDYDVKVKISGEGGSTPFNELEKGSIKATITVTGWTDGTPVTVEI